MRKMLVARRALFLAVCAAVAAVAGNAPAQGQAPQPPNSVFDDLIKTGVPFAAGPRKIRPPTLPDGLGAAEQKKAIEAMLKLKKSNPPTYAQFIKENRNSPYVFLINDGRTDVGNQGPPGHSIDLWFVAHGKLAAITDPQFLKQQFKPDASDQIDVLQPDQLPMEIKTQKFPGGGEWFVHGQFMIMSKDQRVKVRGTAHAMETTTPESGTLAAIVDQHFNQNPAYPNEFRLVLRDGNGNVLRDTKGNSQLGPPTVYYSTGGYIKATQLKQPATAIFVEYHLVYDEPTAWFGGANLLRSKLYGKTETDVHNFRSEVKKATDESAKK